MGTSLAPAIMSPEFLRRALRVRAEGNPDNMTTQTVGIMCRLIHSSAKDPLIWETAINAVDRYLSTKVEPFNDSQTVCNGCWWFAKDRLKFVHHEKLIRDWFQEKNQLQLLIEPSVLLRMPDVQWLMVGDCAIYSMLICAMLEALEVAWRLVTLACDPRQPAIFTHVFARGQVPDGSWLTLDASHGKYPGWQVPADHTFREQAWDENGMPVGVEHEGLE